MLFDRDPHFWGSLFCCCVGYAVIANVPRLRTKKSYSAAYKQNSSEIFSCKYFQNPWHIKTAMLDYNQYMSCHTALLRGLFGKGLASHWGETLVLFSFPLIALFTAWGTYMSAQVFHQMNANLDTGQAQSQNRNCVVNCKYLIHTYTPPFLKKS